MLFFTLSTLALASASPVLRRAATLDQKAVAESQKKDNTATRAFTGVPIKTSDGKCLNVVATAGDFRENLIPITAAACDNSAGQQWDVITKGEHNDQAGFALLVSSLTQGCMNFDPRRAAGNQVLLFSCGGRADGGGAVTNSQLFAFKGGAGPLPLVPQNGNNAVCLTVSGANLDQAKCDPASASGAELFTFGGGGGKAAATGTAAATNKAATQVTGAAVDKAKKVKAKAVNDPKTSAKTKTRRASTAKDDTKTGTAKGDVTIDQAAAAEAQKKDATATRALTAAAIKAADGSCLFIDPNSGNNRENQIPIKTAKCDGSAGQQWDVITKGEHIDKAGNALIVSTQTNGCLNFDPRKAPGKQVVLFSCGGRADGGGKTTNSQFFPFTNADVGKPIALAPGSGSGKVCLQVKNGVLDQAACDATKPAADQLFTLG